MQATPDRRVTATVLFLTGFFLASVGALSLLERLGVPTDILSALLTALCAGAVFLFGLSGATTMAQRFFGGTITPGGSLPASAYAVLVPGAGFLIATPGYSLAQNSLFWPLVAGMVCAALAGAAFVAPRMAASRVTTIPAIIFHMTGSRILSFLAFALTLATAFVILMVHTGLASLLIAGITGWSISNSLVVALALPAIPVLAGGMQSGQRIQSLAYGFVLVALAVVLIILSSEIGLSVFSLNAPADLAPLSLSTSDSALGRLQAMEWPIATMSGPAGGLAAFLCSFAIVMTLPHLVGRTAGIAPVRPLYGTARLALMIVLPIAALISLGPIAALLADSTLAGIPASSVAATAPWMFEHLFTLTGHALSVCSTPAGSPEAVIAGCGGPAREIAASDIALNAPVAGLIPAFFEGLPVAATPAFLLAFTVASLAAMSALFNTLSVLIADEVAQPYKHGGHGSVALGRTSVLVTASLAAFALTHVPFSLLHSIWIPGLAASVLFWPLVAFANGRGLGRTTVAITMGVGAVIPLSLLGAAIWNDAREEPAGPFLTWVAGLPSVSVIAIGLVASGLIMAMLMGLEKTPDETSDMKGEETGNARGAHSPLGT